MQLKNFKKNDIVGFSEPNDLAGHLLRSRLAKKFGLFSEIPMWGGVKLHQFYPPLSSILINIFSLKIALLLGIIYGFSIFSFFKSPLTGLLFVVSYFFLSSFVYCGRFPEIIGHLLVIHAFFSNNFLVSGLLLGLAGLAHPLAFMFGSFLLLSRLNIYIYLIGFIVCGWWLLPFFLKRKTVGYLVKGKEYGAFLSIYWLSWATMINILLFIFFPLPAAGVFGIFCWFTSWFDNELRIKKIISKPLFLNDVPNLYPGIDKVKIKNVVILPKQERKVPSSSIWSGIWAISSFLLEKGIIVYNGIAETEIPFRKINLPRKIKIYRF